MENLKERLVRPKFRWEGDIKMDLQELEWEAWTGFVAHYVDEWPAVLKDMMNILIPQNSVHVWTI